MTRPILSALTLVASIALAGCATEPLLPDYEPPAPESFDRSSFEMVWVSTDLDPDAVEAGEVALEPLVVAQAESTCRDEPEVYRTEAEVVSVGTFLPEPAVRVYGAYGCTPASNPGGGAAIGDSGAPSFDTGGNGQI